MVIEMEMPIEQVQRLLGHVRFDTTLIRFNFAMIDNCLTAKLQK